MPTLHPLSLPFIPTMLCQTPSCRCDWTTSHIFFYPRDSLTMKWGKFGRTPPSTSIYAVWTFEKINFLWIAPDQWETESLTSGRQKYSPLLFLVGQIWDTFYKVSQKVPAARRCIYPQSNQMKNSSLLGPRKGGQKINPKKNHDRKLKRHGVFTQGPTCSSKELQKERTEKVGIIREEHLPNW